ncbi:hypothetical protein SAMN05444156_1785 [Verrucomicrobium sp. GAS474]|uniref:hypothetical protein n=1 Tax=Verrucomicrobium sp. GAS474 TaxID=1882831 RepID=UPI00087AC8B9|nr:hypothetical protein [Verrucomicrobium sp. GAS474]SDU07026.1 hypothetical protein SAMN05444156_1785 [Verrucomicrobium sp. GAS474]
MKTFLLSFSKIGFGVAVLAVAMMLSLTPAFAADEKKAEFSIKIEGGKAIVSDANGKVVATVATGTVAQTLTVGGSAIQITFGNDASGNASLSVTPAPGSTAPVSFTINGKRVEVAAPAPGATSPSVVNVTVASNGQTTVTSSGGGSVKVNGQTVANTPAATSPATTGGVDLSNVTSTPSDASVAAVGTAGATGINADGTKSNGTGTTTATLASTTPTIPNPPVVPNLNPAATTQF